MENRFVNERKYENSRKSLLAIVVFSFINVFLILANTGLSFLFSALLPVFCIEVGKTAAEQFAVDSFITTGIVIALLIISLYLMCYFLSKKYRSFMIVALVFFSIDTLFVIWLLTFGDILNGIITVLFHVWGLISLIVGVNARAVLKVMPQDSSSDFRPIPEASEAIATAAKLPTAVLRPDIEKGKILIAERVGDLDIIVKRRYRVTELIVNGMVYAERKGLVEIHYSLDICVNNVAIQAIMESNATIYLYVNGTLMAQKRRLI